MFRSIIAASVMTLGIGFGGTATEAEAGHRHSPRHGHRHHGHHHDHGHHGHYDHGHYDRGYHHHNRVYIQPYSVYGYPAPYQGGGMFLGTDRFRFSLYR